MTSPTAAAQAADVLARSAGAISANPYIGEKLAAALNAEGLLAGGTPRMPVREGVRMVLAAHGLTQDEATQAAARLDTAGLLAKETSHG